MFTVGTFRFLCTRYLQVPVYQVPSGSCVPGTFRFLCTRYLQASGSCVPGTFRFLCTRYLQASGSCVPGTFRFLSTSYLQVPVHQVSSLQIQHIMLSVTCGHRFFSIRSTLPSCSLVGTVPYLDRYQPTLCGVFVFLVYYYYYYLSASTVQ